MTALSDLILIMYNCRINLAVERVVCLVCAG